MPRQLCWLPSFGTSDQKILHLRIAPNEPWRPYTAFPQYAVSDYPIPSGSKGWVTYQKLKQSGWVLVSSSTETATEYKELASNQLPQNL